MSIRPAALHATEILDSRGRPTLTVTVELADDTTTHAGVPSGASTDRARRSSCAMGILTAMPAPVCSARP